MTLLASPLVFVVATVLLALGIHPAGLPAGRWPLVVPAVAVVWLACVLARASALRSRQLLAAGALLSLTGLAYDAVRGVDGVLELAPGESSTRFTETAPGGATLGLRPFGRSLRLDGVDAEGGARLSAVGPDGATNAARVTPRRAASLGPFRFAHGGLRPAPGGGVLHLSVVAAGATTAVDVAAGVPARAADLEIALEQYFPDFALDAQRQPFSRSDEPRNPGALLRVTRGGAEFRVFVLQALPGIHTQPGLDASFSLTGVDAARALRLTVASAPAAAFVAVGALLALLGLVLGLRTSSSGDAAALGASGALALAALLAQVEGGQLLRWRFGAVPGAGLVLGLALLAALAAFLLLGLASLSPGARQVRAAGRSLLPLAATLAWLGVGVVFFRSEPSRSLAAVAVGAALASLGALALLQPRGGAARFFGAVADLAGPAFAIAVIAVGWLGWQSAGRYDTRAAQGALAAALLGLALREPAGAARAAAVLFVGAASWLLVS